MGDLVYAAKIYTETRSAILLPDHYNRRAPRAIGGSDNALHPPHFQHLFHFPIDHSLHDQISRPVPLFDQCCVFQSDVVLCPLGGSPDPLELSEFALEKRLRSPGVWLANSLAALHCLSSRMADKGGRGTLSLNLTCMSTSKRRSLFISDNIVNACVISFLPTRRETVRWCSVHQQDLPRLPRLIYYSFPTERVGGIPVYQRDFQL